MLSQKDRKGYLEKKAEKFIKQKPFLYNYLNRFALPQKGGIYYISLKTGDREIPLYINYTNDLATELVVKQMVHITLIEKCGREWLKEQGPEKLSTMQAAAMLSKTLYFRYLVEPDVQEQMALTVTAVTLLRPGYSGN